MARGRSSPARPRARARRSRVQIAAQGVNVVLVARRPDPAQRARGADPRGIRRRDARRRARPERARRQRRACRRDRGSRRRPADLQRRCRRVRHEVPRRRRRPLGGDGPSQLRGAAPSVSSLRTADGRSWARRDPPRHVGCGVGGWRPSRHVRRPRRRSTWCSAKGLWAELAPKGVDVLSFVLGQTDTPGVPRARRQVRHDARRDGRCRRRRSRRPRAPR